MDIDRKAIRDIKNDFSRSDLVPEIVGEGLAMELSPSADEKFMATVAAYNNAIMRKANK